MRGGNARGVNAVQGQSRELAAARSPADTSPFEAAGREALVLLVTLARRAG